MIHYYILSYIYYYVIDTYQLITIVNILYGSVSNDKIMLLKFGKIFFNNKNLLPKVICISYRNRSIPNLIPYIFILSYNLY